MNDRISPAVDVTIGGQTRIYHAFITTAPIALDGPSTLTRTNPASPMWRDLRPIRSRSIEHSGTPPLGWC